MHRLIEKLHVLGSENEMVRPNDESLNHFVPNEDVNEVFDVLQEWNDYLEKNVPDFQEPQP